MSETDKSDDASASRNVERTAGNASRRTFIAQSLAAGATILGAGPARLRAGGTGTMAAPSARILPMSARPNILYVIMEDISPVLGCYGAPLVRTPNVDRFAAQGVRFSRTFCTAPVCSPSRSAIFTGCYQTFTGTHQHRTWAWNKRPLPVPVRHLCDWFRAGGYFTCNLRPSAEQMNEIDPETRRRRLWGDRGSGKIDLNFTVNEPRTDDPFEGRDWTERKPGQPFFAHITIIETHKGDGWTAARRQPPGERVNPAEIKLPPYWPDDPVCREEYADFLDVLHLSDRYVGRLLARLEREGLAENTIVVISSDHGSLFRGKQFLYEDGIHIPLIIRFPDERNAGTVDHRLVSSIDLAPTFLGFAGIKPPPGAVQGRDLFDPREPPRDCVFIARDRMDDSIDRMRGIRTDRYKYIRNDLPAVPYMQHNRYKEDNYPTWNLVKAMYANGQLNAVRAAFARPVKPIEELYDLTADPWETNNLAGDPAHGATLEELRDRVRAWQREYDRAGAYEDRVDIERGYLLDPHRS